MTGKIVELLKEQGYRITPVRLAVLGVLEKKAKPLSVEILLKELSKKGLYPNKTTVYREIEALTEGGFVKEVKLSGVHRLYEITSLGHHHHLVCTRCESVEDVHIEDDMGSYGKKIMKKTNFLISDHALEFFGLCGKCQAA